MAFYFIAAIPHEIVKNKFPNVHYFLFVMLSFR